MAKPPRRTTSAVVRTGPIGRKSAPRRMKASEQLRARASDGKSSSHTERDVARDPTAERPRAAEAPKRSIARKPVRKVSNAAQGADGLAAPSQLEAIAESQTRTAPTDAAKAASTSARGRPQQRRKPRASQDGVSSRPPGTPDPDVTPDRERTLEQLVPSSTSASELAGALSNELAEFSRSLIEDSSSRAKELTSARSLPELLEVYGRQLQTVSEAWLRHVMRVRQIYMSTLRRGNDD
jgi:Phasin protein